MSETKTSFVDVDRVVDRLDLSQVFSFYGYAIPEQRSGNNLRMECPVNDCEPSSYGKLSVSEATPYRIKCHSCGIAGNVFMLMWIMKHHEPPEGSQLRGQQFTEMRDDLVQIAGGELESQSPAPRPSQVVKVETEVEPNQPLANSENERARATALLHARTTSDIADMPPPASRYFRERPFLTPEMCDKWKQWKLGYLPMSNGTLQGRIISPIESEAGEVLAWTGRDPDYHNKQLAWKKTIKGTEPMKYRYPSEKYFRRGLELFGQQSDRLQEDGYRAAIERLGILIVEGQNDVIALDALQQPAVAIMSNHITEQQIGKVVRWARQLASGKVSVMLDGDALGIEGARDAVYRLSQQTPVQSIELPDDRQPESLSFEEWREIHNGLVRRWAQ